MIDALDIATFTRWLDETTSRAERASAEQRHKLASEYAHNGLKFCRTLRREAANHGFLAEVLVSPFEARLNSVLTPVC